MFSHLSRIQHVPYLESKSLGVFYGSSGIWLHCPSVRAQRLCKPSQPHSGALVTVAPRVPRGREAGTPWACWAVTVLEQIQAGLREPPVSCCQLAMSLRACSTSVWSPLDRCINPSVLAFLPLGFQWAFTAKKRKTFVFLCFLFPWCKSRQVLEVQQSTETFPVYQTHQRKQR